MTYLTELLEFCRKEGVCSEVVKYELGNVAGIRSPKGLHIMKIISNGFSEWDGSHGMVLHNKRSSCLWKGMSLGWRSD
jgi:hypothetical protein